MQNAIVKSGSQLPAITSKSVSLTTDEQYYLNLEKEYTIKQYEQLKLKDENSGHSGASLARYHIGIFLEQVYEIVGLKRENYPSKELAKRIARYVQETFPYISPSEIVKAVEMGLQGKYPAVKHDNSSIFEHYQVMDLTYINDILSAYVKFRYDKKTTLDKKLEESKTPSMTDLWKQLQQSDKTVKVMIRVAFRKFKKNKEQVPWIRETWFDFMRDIGMIAEDRERWNARYNTMVDAMGNKLSKRECLHRVKVIIMYEFFQKIIDHRDPFEKFRHVTYVDKSIHSTLHAIFRKKDN